MSKQRPFNLLQERIKRDVSQTQIAKMLHVSVPTVSRWENGKSSMPKGYIILLGLLWKTHELKN